MCHKVKTIAKNSCGQLSFCEACRTYHLTFNNLYIEFTPKGMCSFQKFVEAIEVDYWEDKYDGMVTKRTIPIKTMQQNLTMMFNKQELQALKDLIFKKTKRAEDSLTVLDIDYTLFLN